MKRTNPNCRSGPRSMIRLSYALPAFKFGSLFLLPKTDLAERRSRDVPRRILR
jgi:hypothetical protein